MKVRALRMLEKKMSKATISEEKTFSKRPAFGGLYGR